MNPDRFEDRLGLNVPHEWWPGAAMLKELEAAGFTSVQVPSPPEEVLRDHRLGSRLAAVQLEALQTTGLEAVLHAPASLCAGSPEGDLIFEALLSYAAEIGASHLVYHAAAYPNERASEDWLLAETRSLARHAATAERIGVAIAIENLAPVFPGPETLSATPMLLRTIVRRIGSPALGICLDIGHANVIAGLRCADPIELIEPALDSTILFHLHDNFGARRGRDAPPELDPVRLDLHLPPGRGTLAWERLAPYLERSPGPLMLEIHPPHRPQPAQLRAEALRALGLDFARPGGAPAKDVRRIRV